MDDNTLAYLILPFAAEYQYLQLASVSQTWRKVLKKIKYKQQTSYKSVVTSVLMLQWAYENKIPWNRVTCRYVAQSGNLNILIWARENGCPWDERTCTCAAKFGHFEILQWAREWMSLG